MVSADSVISRLTHCIDDAVFLSPDTLNCTAHVSKGPLMRFEEVWNRSSLNVFSGQRILLLFLYLSHSHDELFHDVLPHMLLTKSDI